MVKIRINAEIQADFIIKLMSLMVVIVQLVQVVLPVRVLMENVYQKRQVVS